MQENEAWIFRKSTFKNLRAGWYDRIDDLI